MGVIVNDLVRRLLSPSTLEQLPLLKESFRVASPFRYIVIDDFFEGGFADSLLAEFPTFDQEARDEFGKRSRKSVISSLSSISPAYRVADEMISSRSFLRWVEEITSIDGLEHDPDYFGGGTHENLHGQDLDPHVDFNLHPTTGAHRRLNLIVYLNREWRSSWGGEIELHSNPRDPRSNTVRSYAPSFNRAILFETNEHSWHGFPRINLPESEQRRSRKSLSIYLYTQEPPETAVASHATFYVQRPISDLLRVGDTVTQEMIAGITEMIERRNHFIDYYQKKEIDNSTTLDRVSQRFQEWSISTLVPTTGPVVLQRSTRGFEPDGWMLATGAFQCEATADVSHLRVDGWLPGAETNVRITVSLLDATHETMARRGETFALEIPMRAAAGERINVEITVGDPFRPSSCLAGSSDDRELGCLLRRVTFS